MINEISHIIAQMQPVSLAEMDSVKLLNRTDTKFVFEISKLPKILADVKDAYRVLHVAQTPFQEYFTVYYDTADKKMYQIHQTGRINRYKVRHRTYGSSGIAFLEVKFKNNKKITFKNRIKYDIAQGLENAQEFLQKYSPFSWDELEATSKVTYTRITLVNLMHGERITIDVDLQASNVKTGKTVDFSHICIVELKREKTKSNTEMAEALKKHRIFQKSMSKYAVGTAASNSEVQLNRFKRKLRYIDKLKTKI